MALVAVKLSNCMMNELRALAQLLLDN